MTFFLACAFALVCASAAEPCPPTFPVTLDNCGPASGIGLLGSPLCGECGLGASCGLGCGLGYGSGCGLVGVGCGLGGVGCGLGGVGCGLGCLADCGLGCGADCGLGCGPVCGAGCGSCCTGAGLLNLPCPSPVSTRTIANKCVCTKTVARPQLVKQIINVPTCRKFIQTLARPVVENIQYNARPVNCPTFEPTVPACSPLGLGCRSSLSLPCVS